MRKRFTCKVNGSRPTIVDGGGNEEAGKDEGGTSDGDDAENCTSSEEGLSCRTK
jgi:hypothetical protein